MTGAHLHLVLNHIPVVGTMIGIALLAFALLRRDSSLAKVTLGLFVALGAAAVLVFLTGEPAEEGVEHLPGVAERFIEAHEDAARVAMISAIALGTVALGLLGWFRRRSLPPRMAALCLVLAIGVGGAMAWTANLGGRIRHSEIRAPANTEEGTWDASH